MKFNKEKAVLSVPSGKNEPWTSETEVGGFIHFIINNQTYLVGHNSIDKEIISKLVKGKYDVTISGEVKKESKHFPNPMVEFEVIELTEFSIK